MRRTTGIAFLLLSSVVFCVATNADDSGCPTSGFDEKTVPFQQYLVRTIRQEGQGCIEVRKDGKAVYSEHDALSYVIGNNAEDGAGNPTIKPGTSITGSGKPELVYSSWSGGAHCCFTFTVLQFGDKPRAVAKLKAMHSGGAHFADLNHDGTYEFVSNDWTFAYWHASFAESPAPAVIMALRKDNEGSYQYRLDLDLMRKPAPTPADLDQRIQKIRDDEAWKDGLNPALWTAMLELIYSGHPDLAWQVFDRAWPVSKPGKSGFLGAFCERLQTSEYFWDLAKSLENHPADCYLPK